MKESTNHKWYEMTEDQLSEHHKEILKSMDGKEIRSTRAYQTIVLVDGDKVISGGEQIDTLDSEEKISTLQEDLVEDEFGSQKALMEDLREEFGEEVTL